MQQNITPLPWRVSAADRAGAIAIVGARTEGVPGTPVVCDVAPRDMQGDGAANAAFIVKAVNAHDQLVAALKRFTVYGKTFAYREADGCPIDQALAALAAAGE